MDITEEGMATTIKVRKFKLGKSLSSICGSKQQSVQEESLFFCSSLVTNKDSSQSQGKLDTLTCTNLNSNTEIENDWKSLQRENSTIFLKVL